MTFKLLNKSDSWKWLGAGVLFAAAVVFVLRSMGRVWWCKCAEFHPWIGDTWSMHNSQHLLDPYSLSHMQHGMLFYGALFWLAGSRLSVKFRCAIALALEATWEIAENTPWMIEKYRTATVSLDYFGDSIVNSSSDIVSCAVGWCLATYLPGRLTIALFLAIEIGMLFWIRDSLSLNVIMLLFSSDAIKAWQMGG